MFVNVFGDNFKIATLNRAHLKSTSRFVLQPYVSLSAVSLSTILRQNKTILPVEIRTRIYTGVPTAGWPVYVYVLLSWIMRLEGSFLLKKKTIVYSRTIPGDIIQPTHLSDRLINFGTFHVDSEETDTNIIIINFTKHLPVFTTRNV